MGTSPGADGRVSRLRSSPPTAIVSSTSSLSRVASAESLRSGAVGCVSRPRSSTWRSSLFSISSLFFLASSRIACYCSLTTLVLGISIFKFSSGVVSRSTIVERLVLFHLPAELDFLCSRWASGHVVHCRLVCRGSICSGSGAPGWALHRTPGWVLVRLSTVSLSRVWVHQKWFHSLVEVEGPVVDTRAGCFRMSRVMDLYRNEDWLSLDGLGPRILADTRTGCP